MIINFSTLPDFAWNAVVEMTYLFTLKNGLKLSSNQRKHKFCLEHFKNSSSSNDDTEILGKTSKSTYDKNVFAAAPFYNIYHKQAVCNS